MFWMEENNCWRYHLYLIREEVELKDMVAFLYGDLIPREVLNIRKVPLEDVHLLSMCQTKGADDKMTRNTVSLKRTGERHESSAIDL